MKYLIKILVNMINKQIMRIILKDIDVNLTNVTHLRN